MSTSYSKAAVNRDIFTTMRIPNFLLMTCRSKGHYDGTAQSLTFNMSFEGQLT